MQQFNYTHAEAYLDFLDGDVELEISVYKDAGVEQFAVIGEKDEDHNFTGFRVMPWHQNTKPVEGWNYYSTFNDWVQNS